MTIQLNFNEEYEYLSFSSGSIADLTDKMNSASKTHDYVALSEPQTKGRNREMYYVTMVRKIGDK